MLDFQSNQTHWQIIELNKRQKPKSFILVTLKTTIIKQYTKNQNTKTGKNCPLICFTKFRDNPKFTLSIIILIKIYIIVFRKVMIKMYDKYLIFFFNILV